MHKLYKSDERSKLRTELKEWHGDLKREPMNIDDTR